MLTAIKSILFYGGLEKAQYRAIRERVRKDNDTLLHNVTFTAAVIFSVLVVTSIFAPAFSYSRDMNLTGFFICWLLWLAMLFLPQNKINSYVVGYLLIAMGYTYGIIVTIKGMSNLPAITYTCIMAIIPFILMDVPWRLLLAMIMGGGAFLAMSSLYNTREIYLINLQNVIPLANFSALLNIMLTVASFRREYRAYHAEETIRQQAEIDPLTTVYNRKKLRTLLKEDGVALNVPDGVVVTILMMDIDHFKRVNDTYGHDAGDKILAFVAGQIHTGVRDSDYVIRWGGEEFVVILPETPLESGVRIAERIRRSIKESDNGVCPVTISIGATCYDGRDLEASMKLADTLLYQAKEGGRDQVRSQSDEENIWGI